jgi:high mobility group protein B1
MPKAKTAPIAKKPVRKQKKVKDPNKPKRPMTAFFVFSGEFRDEVKAQNPGSKVGDVAKILGERWRAMSDAQKVPYQAKVEADRKRYDAEMAIFGSK